MSINFMATPESSRDFSYVTAPCTPIRCRSLDHMYFHSVPTSPTKFSPREPTTPNPYVDASSFRNEFQFETSYRFDTNDSDIEVGPNFDHILMKEEGKRQCGDSLPAMSFADELFCDGKVMPLRPPPLKLPPRLQHNGFTNPDDSSLSSRGRKLLFSSWREYDSDPFVVAMKKVSKDKRKKRKSPKTGRPNGSLVYATNNRSGPIILVQQPGPSEGGGNKSIKLAEPKGLSFARSLRLVSMGQEGPMKVEGKGCNSKRHKIKEFLFRTPTMKVDKSEEKMVDPNSPHAMARRFSFKSGRSVQMYGEKEKKVSQVTDGALVQYRPSLFLCLGYGMKKSTF